MRRARYPRIEMDQSVAAGTAKHGVADHLIDLAKVEGADLIVTGAYGHSRWANGLRRRYAGTPCVKLGALPHVKLKLDDHSPVGGAPRREVKQPVTFCSCDVLVNDVAQLRSRGRTPDISNQ